MMLVHIMLETKIFRQFSAKLLPKTKSSTIVETYFGMGSLAKGCFQPLVNRI